MVRLRDLGSSGRRTPHIFFDDSPTFAGAAKSGQADTQFRR
jgi:hypothetical protein